MRHTLRYKTGYIHLSYVNGHELVYCCVQPDAYTMQAKSLRAAKLRITKHANKIGGMK
jgi:hypothetical protein